VEQTVSLVLQVSVAYIPVVQALAVSAAAYTLASLVSQVAVYKQGSIVQAVLAVYTLVVVE
jgi:hypothetical protein